MTRAEDAKPTVKELLAQSLKNQAAILGWMFGEYLDIPKNKKNAAKKCFNLMCETKDLIGKQILSKANK